MSRQYLTVSQLTQYVSLKFDKDPYLQKVFLTGELSNFNPKSYSHKYFTLKDDKTQISAVMFKSDYNRVAFQPKDGDKVLVRGRVQVYKPQGRYQIIVEAMEPDGLGQLYLQLEETKKRLKEEGVFDRKKKPIPAFPKKIAIVTSPTGAVIRDIIRNVRQRYPIVQLVLYPTLVQGKQAAVSIATNVKRADASGEFDTIIVGRGGGSFEDLFAFNEEEVVRAVADATTPIISSIGHETDTTLTDYAADYSASTPTEAAVHATPVLRDVLYTIDQYNMRLNQAFSNRLNQYNKRLNRALESYVFQNPQRLYESHSQSLDLLNQSLLTQARQLVQKKQNDYFKTHSRLLNQTPQHRLTQAQNQLNYVDQRLIQVFKHYLNNTDNRLKQSIQALDMLSPLKILARGYSYTVKDGEVVKSVDQVEPGDSLSIHLEDGRIQATVDQTERG